MERLQDKAWLSRVQSVGCILCLHLALGETPATVHHVREGQGKGQRASDYLAIPLCKEHHQGTSGYHGLGASGFYQRYRLDELDLLALTLSRLV